MRRSIDPETDSASHFSVVVLATGKSSRMGLSGGQKLLGTFDGVPLVRRSTALACGCYSRSVIVVTGYQHLEIRNALEGLEVEIVHNIAYASGIASSIRVGVAAVERDQPHGILIMLADMPLLKTADLNCLIEAFRARDAVLICV